MPRRRYISTEISSDRSIANLAKEYGDFAAMLYTWLIPHAEDDGCVYGDVGKIALLVLPGFRWKTDEDITRALEGMNKYGLIAWEPEQDIIRFPSSFFKYQSYIGKGRKAKAENKHSTPQNTAGQDNNTACESDTAEQRETPQNAANLGSAAGVPQNAPSLSSSFSFKSSSSSLKDKDINTQDKDPVCLLGEASAASPQPADCPHGEIVKLYHEILPELPQVKDWTPQRQEYLRARWRSAPERQTLDFWREYFLSVRNMDWLMGRKEGRDGRPFFATLEWLVRPTNFNKVIEGFYASHENKTGVTEAEKKAIIAKYTDKEGQRDDTAIYRELQSLRRERGEIS